MATLRIVKYGDPILSKVARPVEKIDGEISRVVNDMFETMYAAPGVGLAAPQVGIPLRIIVLDESVKDGRRDKPIALINPVIKRSSGLIAAVEGCLSIPGIYELVERAKEVVVEALTPEGEEVRVEAKDTLARILQHEIDHLDGILFVDRLPPSRRMMLRRDLERIRRSSIG
jgi:peptide deformylase